MTQKINWAVGLSDGSNLYENKGEYCEKKGELSPWLKLQKHLELNGVKITSLSLFTDDGRVWNLPSLGKNPKFADFGNLDRPIEYRAFHKVGFDIEDQGNTDRYVVIEAIYSDQRLQLWVSEKEPYPCWTIVRKVV